MATKLLVPRVAADRVPRVRLVEQIQSAQRLTVLSAPAGSGKTTLLVDWIESLDPAVAWLSLDEEDNRVERFSSHLLGALARARPHWGRLVKAAGARAGGSTDEETPPALTELLNRMVEESEPLTLILDDLHVVHEDAVYRILERVISRQPPHLHIVLSGRRDPALPLARLRAQRELCEIREPDLRFTRDEAGDFLNRTLNLGLSAADVATLHSRTEGWIAGLQLAGLSLRGAPDPRKAIAEFSGDHRYIVDFLADEVLRGQSAETYGLLLRTSILEELCAPLCEALTGQTGAREVLESLEKANLPRRNKLLSSH